MSETSSELSESGSDSDYASDEVPVPTSDDFNAFCKYGAWWRQSVMRRGLADPKVRCTISCQEHGDPGSNGKQALRIQRFVAELREFGFAKIKLVGEKPEQCGNKWLNDRGELVCGKHDHYDSKHGKSVGPFCGGIYCKYDRQTVLRPSPNGSESSGFETQNSGGFVAPAVACQQCGDKFGPMDVWYNCSLCRNDDIYGSDVCQVCFNDLKKQTGGDSIEFADIIPRTIDYVNNHFDLDRGAKNALGARIGNATDEGGLDGYLHIDRNKEMLHFQNDVFTTEQGRLNAVSVLRARLNALGANITSCLSTWRPSGCGIPTPVHKGRMPGQRFGPMYFSCAAAAGSEEQEIFMHDSDRDRANNWDLWVMRGLTCPQTSVLSAFHYFPDKPSEQIEHCIPHTDKGVLSILLNPADVQVKVEGTWTPVCSSATEEEQYAVVLVGQTLEAATCGLFKAALHRVVNHGQARTSVVAKIRAPPSAVLDLEWAMQWATEYNPQFAVSANSRVTVRDILTQLSERGSVNEDSTATAAAVVAPAAPDSSTAIAGGRQPKWPKHTKHSMLACCSEAALLDCAGYLPAGDAIRFGGVCKWLNALLTQGKVWIRAARLAGIDWASMVKPNQPAHVAIGPVLHRYQQNTTIELVLIWDGIGARGKELGEWQAESMSGFRPQRVTIDQRTPIRIVIDRFVDSLLEFDQAQVRNEVYEYPQVEVQSSSEKIVVHQGRENTSGDFASNQQINTDLTALHFELVSGAELNVSRENYAPCD